MVSHLEAIRTLIREERLGAAVTVIEGPNEGCKAVVDRSSGIVAGYLPPTIAADVISDSEALMDREQSWMLVYGEDAVFIESVAPQPHLLIFGAVHIAQELCRIAAGLGFRVTINDARSAFANAERFPEADAIVVGWPNDVADQLLVDGRTYVVLLSHDPRFEEPVLPMVLKSSAKYVGAMGSRRTHQARLERLEAAGFEPDQISRIHGPVGLDIGAETPGEVAVSILAEMIQVRYGSGSGESLAGQSGPIHPQRSDQ